MTGGAYCENVVLLHSIDNAVERARRLHLLEPDECLGVGPLLEHKSIDSDIVMTAKEFELAMDANKRANVNERFRLVLGLDIPVRARNETGSII